MSLLSDVRFFLKKHLKNPVILGAIAYIIYMMINKHQKKESLQESVKVIKSKGSRTVIFDDATKKYILVDFTGEVFSSNKPDKLLKMLG